MEETCNCYRLGSNNQYKGVSSCGVLLIEIFVFQQSDACDAFGRHPPSVLDHYMTMCAAKTLY